MSFSGMVKDELSKHVGSARHCRIAETAAILSACGRMEQYHNGSERLRVQTENEAVVRKCFTLLRKTFNIETEIAIRENSHLKRGNVYFIEISDQAQIQAVLQGTKLSVNGNAGGTLNLNNSLVIQQNCCKRAFIRGAFLSSGSISDPEKGYHFEIVCPKEDKAQQLQDIIRSFNIDAKIVLRKKSYVVYVKEGAQIVDMLAIMEANVALMNLENIRILKEMRNSVNRKVNCETANINKTVNAAVKQMEDIKLIEQTVGFQSLNEGLAEIAELRLQYPEATLKELGMMLSPQVGKSGVNHRLRKLSALADELRENKEELL
ncbi:DNA-binding protein WhiA [Blautia schinkii]|nr:DNA-binding protein WhiA [Blautia schinkii]